MTSEFPRCEYCGDYIDDENQSAPVKVKKGYGEAHKQCVMQLTLGTWDELVYRAKVNTPLDAPYTSRYIADPKVRKSLGLDTPEMGRAAGVADFLMGDQDTASYQDIADTLKALVERGDGAIAKGYLADVPRMGSTLVEQKANAEKYLKARYGCNELHVYGWDDGDGAIGVWMDEDCRERNGLK